VPNCQSIAGPPIDQAIGALVTERMTPAAVELALEIRREIEARQQDAGRLRSRAVERAQFEADLAQRRFMLVDPGNRLVADTLEAEWNDKLRALAQAREERERSKQQDQLLLDDALRQRLLTMTKDFKKLWSDPTTLNRERKRLLACIIEDATLIKLPAEGITQVHIRFKGGKTETLTTSNPKLSGEQVRIPPVIIQLVDKLLDNQSEQKVLPKITPQMVRMMFLLAAKAVSSFFSRSVTRFPVTSSCCKLLQNGEEINIRMPRAPMKLSRSDNRLTCGASGN
jgi:hypothetical protein